MQLWRFALVPHAAAPHPRKAYRIVQQIVKLWQHFIYMANNPRVEVLAMRLRMPQLGCNDIVTIRKRNRLPAHCSEVHLSEDAIVPATVCKVPMSETNTLHNLTEHPEAHSRLRSTIYFSYWQQR